MNQHPTISSASVYIFVFKVDLTKMFVYLCRLSCVDYWPPDALWVFHCGFATDSKKICGVLLCSTTRQVNKLAFQQLMDLEQTKKLTVVNLTEKSLSIRGRSFVKHSSILNSFSGRMMTSLIDPPNSYSTTSNPPDFFLWHF